MADTTKTPVLSNGAYDVIKDVVTMFIPALGVFYASIAAIWNLPFSVEVTGTLAAIATILGVLLKVAANQFAKTPENNAGTVVVNTTDPTVPDVHANVQIPMDQLKGANTVTLKVLDQSNPTGEPGRDF